jgi:hypothetical protein
MAMRQAKSGTAVVEIRQIGDVCHCRDLPTRLNQRWRARSRLQGNSRGRCSKSRLLPTCGGVLIVLGR